MTHDLPSPSLVTMYGLAALAVLVLVQVAVAAAATQSAGLVPGVPIEAGPSSFAFRAHRAHQNTLENLVPFLVALAAAIGVGVTPRFVEAAVVAFVITRVAHALAYYAGARTARTAAFGVGLAVVLAMTAATFLDADAPHAPAPHSESPR